jgi:hypothetical protein
MVPLYESWAKKGRKGTMGHSRSPVDLFDEQAVVRDPVHLADDPVVHLERSWPCDLLFCARSDTARQILFKRERVDGDERVRRSWLGISVVKGGTENKWGSEVGTLSPTSAWTRRR